MAEHRVVLVTGTSGGIGRSIAELLGRRGWRVLGSARNPSGDDADVLRLDVTDDASAQAAVDAVVQRAGRLDALVNNAGTDIDGAVEETSPDEALALLDTNLLGVHRMVRAALPVMRGQGGGRILVIGSLAGTIPIPFDAFYVASKHAVEGYVKTLRFEVAPFGVQAGVIEPGFIRTGLREHKRDVQESLPAYSAARRAAGAAFDRAVARGIPPERVATAVARVLDARTVPLHTPVGMDARVLPALQRVLPDRAWRAGMQRRFS